MSWTKILLDYGRSGVLAAIARVNRGEDAAPTQSRNNQFFLRVPSRPSRIASGLSG